ncbi:MAG TPA: hypothetical protein PK867_02255 [Pirellulales bacterium]|nr:hypothetical protein [Pirellulales bacterium]
MPVPIIPKGYVACQAKVTLRAARSEVRGAEVSVGNALRGVSRPGNGRACITGTPTGTIEEQQYHRNYGDTSLPSGSTSTYSRFLYSIPLVRPNWGYL